MKEAEEGRQADVEVLNEDLAFREHGYLGFGLRDCLGFEVE